MNVVIFDFDGVLFDSFDQVYAIITNVFREAGFAKIQTKEEFKELFMKNFYESIAERGFQFTPQVKKSMIEQLKKDYHPVLFKGMKEIVVKQGAKNTVLAVESSNFESIMNELLEKNNLKVYFEYVVGADQITSKTERLLHLKKKLNPEKIIFITDTVGDILEAKSINIPVIGVSWGYHSHQQLKKAQPLIVVDSPQELMKMLEEL